MKNMQRGFAFLELIVVLVVVCALAAFAVKAYTRPPKLDTDTRQALQQQGLNTTDTAHITKDVAKKLQEIDEMQRARTKDLGGL